MKVAHLYIVEWQAHLELLNLIHLRGTFLCDFFGLYLNICLLLLNLCRFEILCLLRNILLFEVLLV